MLDPAAAAVVAERARKARATKGAADGKNNAAAGSAAAVDGWLGPVDESGLMLGLDDISWDEELLLGESGEPGFGLGGLRFEPNSRLSFGLAPSRSGLGSQVGEGQQPGCNLIVDGLGQVAWDKHPVCCPSH
jgi:hypothetical protein